jgi:inosine-uridine nucleoside N-ribohydrolase
MKNDLSITAGKPADYGRSNLFGKNTLGRIVGAIQRLEARAFRRDVLVCTDCSTFDDRAALAFLALAPRWRLQGVVATMTASDQHKPTPTTHGYAPIIVEADPVVACLDALPLRQPPRVVSGSTHRYRQMRADEHNGCDFIIEAAKSHSNRNRLVVVVMGAATDVAAALAKDARLEDRIEVVAAAFDKWPEGGDSAKARHDIEAWQIIMDSEVQLTVASTTEARIHLSLSPRKAITRLRARARDEQAKKIFAWLESGQPPEETADGRPPAMRGLLAVAHVLGHAGTTLYPRPTLKDDTGFLHGGSTAALPCQTCIGEPRIKWITELDEKGLWADLVYLLSNYGSENLRSTGKSK